MSKKVAIITCYEQPDYVRAVVLRRALSQIVGIKLTIVKNSNKNSLRYLEIIWKLLNLRIRQNPDIYLITFRGYEILPLVRIFGAGKKIIFDEFINPIEWFVYEHKKIKPNGLVRKSLQKIYTELLNGTQIILTDTIAHASYSANLLDLPLAKYKVIPVGTDEQVFKVMSDIEKEVKFTVFYYATMLPLHGLTIIFKAAERVNAKNKEVLFVIVGNKPGLKKLINKSVLKGANIKHIEWLKFEALADYARRSHLCLGGPFGNTPQAQMVITGKTYQFMSAGLPTVIGGIKDNTPFIDKQNCLLVQQGNADALSEVILWAADHPQELGEIGAKGRELFMQNFSTAQIAKKLESFILE
ncbi:MAG: glycosyltransferase family 4 protein [bacterium]|nr:glycosyltransferase family 4 protein [bacterium]